MDAVLSVIIKSARYYSTVPLKTTIVIAFLKKIPPSVIAATLISVAVPFFGFAVMYFSQGVQHLIWGDGIGYLELSENLSRGRGFSAVWGGESQSYLPEVFRTPGMPFLASLFFSAGLGMAGYLAFVVVLGGIATPLLTWWIAKEWFSDKIAVIAAWLIAVDPLRWVHSWFFLTEGLYVPVLLSGVVAYVYALRRGSVFGAVLAGALLAASQYIRPITLYLVLFPLALTAAVQIAVFARRARAKGKFPFCSAPVRFSFKNSARRLLSSGSAVFLAAVAVFCILLAPWYVRNYVQADTFSFSGAGWRNVYTDYLASLRAIERGKGFSVEKNALKEYAYQTWGMGGYALNNPANADVLKGYIFEELSQTPLKNIVKLQALLFITFMTHADYPKKLEKSGILAPGALRSGISASQVLLHNPLSVAIPTIFLDLKKRLFLPLLERLVYLAFLLLAAIGLFFYGKNFSTWVIVSFVFGGYLLSSVIGFGVEGRLRLPIEPFYFILVAAGAVTVVPLLRRCWPSSKRAAPFS